jgi:hypothetical protein
VAVDDVDESARIERHVVALRRRSARHRLRNEVTDLARGERVGDVDDAQAAAELDRVDERARHALAELMRAEARAAGPAERRIELAHLKLRKRPDGGKIADVEG